MPNGQRCHCQPYSTKCPHCWKERHCYISFLLHILFPRHITQDIHHDAATTSLQLKLYSSLFSLRSIPSFLTTVWLRYISTLLSLSHSGSSFDIESTTYRSDTTTHSLATMLLRSHPIASRSIPSVAVIGIRAMSSSLSLLFSTTSSSVQPKAKKHLVTAEDGVHQNMHLSQECINTHLTITFMCSIGFVSRDVHLR